MDREYKLVWVKDHNGHGFLALKDVLHKIIWTFPVTEEELKKTRLKHK